MQVFRLRKDVMKKLILTTYASKSNGEETVISLLENKEPVSIPLMRKKLKGIDLNNTVVLTTHPKISALFKRDYGFNDHGIYYDVSEHPATGEPINCVVVPLERETKHRDYERFQNYGRFIDPLEGYRVTDKLSEGDTFILDIETTGLDFQKDVLLFLAVKAVGSSEVYIQRYPSVEEVRELFSTLEDCSIVMHNGLFDLSWLMYYAGLEFSPGIKTIDTMLLAHVAGERRLSLKHLSMMYGNFKGRRNTLDADELYLIEDILTTELLWEKFEPKYRTFAGRLVCEAVKTFSECKVNGVHIDADVLFQLRDEYKELEENPYDFNPNSNQELADYFIQNGVELTEKTPSGNYSVAQGVLEQIKHPLVEEYLEYKAKLNIYQKYILPYTNLEEYHLRPNIKLWGTETGRLSCSDPNVQQIPNRSNFKGIFRSRFKNGYIGTIDLDRAELGIAALLSGDRAYAEALTSQDFHRLVAAKTFNLEFDEVTKHQRFIAKSVNFGGVLYGGSARGIANRIGVEEESVFAIQEWYKEAFPVLTKWIDDQKVLAQRTKQVTTYFGRTRYLHGLNYGQVSRFGVNTAVQSVASDVMLFIVVQLSIYMRIEKLKSKILFPVHDELLLDIHPNELEEMEKLLQAAFRAILQTSLGKLELSSILPISGTLEYGDSWLELKSDKYTPNGTLFISSLGGSSA